MNCFLLIPLLISILTLVYSRCPNSCNANGNCDQYGRCECFKGYTGADCSLRLCPSDYSWVDIPYAQDKAHALAECSNMGICNRGSGLCQCNTGYDGEACERMACPFQCGGVGRCYSIKDLASRTTNENSLKFTYNNQWDSGKIVGCHCDKQFTSYDCSKRVCPRGDDPLTSGQVNEVQLFTCVYAGSTGTFVLTYKGYHSQAIPVTATPAMVRAAILQIPIIPDVTVRFSAPTSPVCAIAINVVIVEFTQNFGPLPPFLATPDSIVIAGNGKMNVYADGSTVVVDGTGKSWVSQKGTKEDDLCAYRGLCSTADGICGCFATNGDAYGSSNGYGIAGTRGDCGNIISGLTVSTCPGDTACSGQGVCPNDGTYRCQCNLGFTGGDCSERMCPMGPAWFSYPTGNEEAHLYSLVQCSNMGSCDFSTGICTCLSGFVGDACQFMACPGTSTSQCNSQGRCMTIAQLALWATENGDPRPLSYGGDPNNPATWDANMVQGCLCDPGFTGYDCSLFECPSGKDPAMLDQVDEVQYLNCVADSGTFKLSFRLDTTSDIPATTTARGLYLALKKLPSIRDIQVSFVKLSVNFMDLTENVLSNTSFCENSGLVYARIQFTHTAGNVPALRPDTTLLTTTSTSSTIVVGISVTTDGAFADSGKGQQKLMRSVAGTTENLVCNGRGICDQTNGKCDCFQGFSSSDGSGVQGFSGDCGYRIIAGPKSDL